MGLLEREKIAPGLEEGLVEEAFEKIEKGENINKLNKPASQLRTIIGCSSRDAYEVYLTNRRYRATRVYSLLEGSQLTILTRTIQHT